MAKARKCDICGRLYEMYRYKKKDTDNPNAFMFANVDDDHQYWSHNVIDCCPDCIESIKAHIESLKGDRE